MADITPHIMVVDDSPVDGLFLSTLAQKFFDIPSVHASSGAEALEYVKNDRQSHIATVLLDLSMPTMDGRATLQNLLHLRPDLQVIIITGTSDVANIVDVIKMGAMDYLVKPVDYDLFKNAVGKALHIYNLRKELDELRNKAKTPAAFEALIGHSPAFRTCIRLGQRAATSDITTLITGESGTGKEMIAHAIHAASNRSDKPFVAVNCGAMPKDLVESILFGHKKGSFTGATGEVRGKFLEADGGTLFLDEVGELPLDAQVKLLRVLQEREIEPVGASTSIPVNIRIIAATNRNLSQAVKQSHMREDLFYRLNVFPVHMPSLSERGDDAQDLAVYFLRHYAAQESKPIIGFSPEASQMIAERSWPGNIRELENTIYRAVLLCDDTTITVDHLMHHNPADKPNDVLPPKQDARLIVELLDSTGMFKAMTTIRKEVERHALNHYHNDVTEAAQSLQIGKSTLYRHRH
jgi:hypothetical protein